MNEDFKVGSRVRYKDSECPVLNGHKKGEIYTISKIDDDAIAWFENEKDPCMLSRLELVDNEHAHADLIRKWVTNPAKYIIQCKVDNAWVDIDRAMWDYNTQYRLVDKEKVQIWNWCYVDSNIDYPNYRFVVSPEKYTEEKAKEIFGKSLVQKIDSSMELQYNLT